MARVIFKQITTHPSNRGVFALDTKGQLWQYRFEGKRWDQINHPVIEEKKANDDEKTEE